MVFDKFQQLKELKKMRDEAMRLQKALAQEEVVIEEKGIKVVMGGDQKLKKIEIKGEEDKDLVDVLNKAVKRSQEVAAKKLQQMGGANLPGFLKR